MIDKLQIESTMEFIEGSTKCLMHSLRELKVNIATPHKLACAMACLEDHVNLLKTTEEELKQELIRILTKEPDNDR